MESKKEIFKDVLGYEGILQISNLGNVKKLEHQWLNGNKGAIRKNPEYIMKPRFNLGYLVIDVRINGKSKILKLHRLIATAFIPNPENKPCVNHKDLNRSNNSLENLEWCTYKENSVHARLNKVFKKHNNYAKGEKAGKSKLTESEVLEIRKSSMQGKEIAVIYNVDPSTISRIRSNTYWKHI